MILTAIGTWLRPMAMSAALLWAQTYGAAAAVDCPAAKPVLAATASFQKAARSGSPAAFSAALRNHAAVSTLALQALGPYRSKLPPARKGEFQRNALVFMGRFIAENSEDLRGAKLEITSCRGNTVQSQANGRTIVWRVAGGQIADVKVSGFSLSVQMRKKFVSVIGKNRGDVGKLIDFLGQ